MTSPSASPPPRAEYAVPADLELRLDVLDRKERELDQALAAVEAQRRRLETVRAEYESRRDLLTERMREVDALRNRLREEQAQLLAASLLAEDRERRAASPQPRSEADWWAKQLGSPLEAA